MNHAYSEKSGSVQYEALADLFVEMDVYSSPAELHGLLCGLLVSNAALEQSEWLQRASIFLERSQLDLASAETLLLALHGTTVSQLGGTGFSVDLILPDEDYTTGERAHAIGRWCTGFQAGFTRDKRASLSPEGRESLDDLAAIANIQEPESASEDAEQDLMEITEYVRMAAIMLYSELHTDHKDSPPSQPNTAFH